MVEQLKIGIIWSGKIENKFDLNSDSIIIYDNVKMSDASKYFEELKNLGVETIITTAGLNREIKNRDSINIIVAYPDEMNILDTISYIEHDLGIEGTKIALVIHEDNVLNIKQLNKFIKNTIEPHYFKRESDLNDIAKKISKMDYYGVITGPTFSDLIESIGLRSFPLLFGKDVVIENISKAKEMNEFLYTKNSLTEKIRNVIYELPQAVIITNVNGDILMVNPAIKNVFPEKNISLMDTNVSDLFIDFDLSILEEKEKITKFFRTNNGKEVYLNAKNFNLNLSKHSFSKGFIFYFQETSEIIRIKKHIKETTAKGFVANYQFSDIIHESPSMKSIIKRSKKIAKSEFTVLIEGETGTGKEMFAQSIHNYSSRFKGPFVAVNCANLTDTLLESELFGYEPGAFTGANREGKTGLFEYADGGTIFLDEINQISVPLQKKILRVIQEKLILKIGGDRIIPVDVRIIASSNESLLRKVEKNEFRKDLYYRLNVLNINLPPLRDRTEDLPSLIKFFLNKIFSETGERINIFKDSLIMNYIKNHTWPGNIRELENFIYRYSVVYDGGLDSVVDGYDYFGFDQDLNYQVPDGKLLIQLSSLANMEKEIINHVLDLFKGNQTSASEFLGIHRNTIRNKLNNGGY